MQDQETASNRYGHNKTGSMEKEYVKALSLNAPYPTICNCTSHESAAFKTTRSTRRRYLKIARKYHHIRRYRRSDFTLIAKVKAKNLLRGTVQFRSQCQCRLCGPWIIAPWRPPVLCHLGVPSDSNLSLKINDAVQPSHLSHSTISCPKSSASVFQWSLFMAVAKCCDLASASFSKSFLSSKSPRVDPWESGTFKPAFEKMKIHEALLSSGNG